MEENMINILHFASLALYIYRDKKVNATYLTNLIKKSVLAKNFNPKTFVNGIYEIIVNERKQSLAAANNNAFYASFFVAVYRGKVEAAIIAIRGTDNIDNDIADVTSWWKSFFDDHAQVNLPKYYIEQAISFYYQIKRFMKANPAFAEIPYTKVFVTGHSLGGAIAALMPAYALLPMRAVTFNAPGIKDIPHVHNLSQRVINFRATFDFVSAIDYPIGSDWNVNVPNKEKQAAQAFAIAREHERDGWSRLDIINDLTESTDFLDSVLAQHKMLHLLQSLERLQGYNAYGRYGYDTFISTHRQSQPVKRIA